MCVSLNKTSETPSPPLYVSSNALLAAVRFDVILPPTNERSMTPPLVKHGPDETPDRKQKGFACSGAVGVAGGGGAVGRWGAIRQNKIKNSCGKVSENTPIDHLSNAQVVDHLMKNQIVICLKTPPYNRELYFCDTPAETRKMSTVYNNKFRTEL